MGILRRLREWREDKDGTLIGPDIEADSVDAGSVNTDKAVIGSGQVLGWRLADTLDTASGTTVTKSFNSTQENILLHVKTLVFNGDSGLIELQVNNETGPEYDYVDNSDTKTTGATSWELCNNKFGEATGMIRLFKSGGVGTGISSDFNQGSQTGALIFGNVTVSNGGVNSFTFKCSAGSDVNDVDIDVYTSEDY